MAKKDTTKPDNPGEGKPSVDVELLPPAGDKDLGYAIFRMLDDVLKDKESLGLPKKWTRNYELAHNKHWRGSGGAKVALITANLLHDHRQKTVNMLTDNNPTFNVVLVGGPNDVDPQAQEDLFHATEYWWAEQEQQRVLEKSVINGEIYGCCVEKVVFNPDLEYGLGEVETETVDPFHFGFYPPKIADIQKADAILHYYPMPVRTARRLWPEMADKIKADREYLEELGDTRREIAFGGAASNGVLAGGYFATFKNVVKEMLNPSGSDGSASEETLVVECWCKDYTLDGDTPKYKGYIRCITTCNGGVVVLSDRSNPSVNPELPDEQTQKTWLYDRFPFTLTASITDPLIPWGMSDFEQLEQMQTEINKTISQITLYKDKASRLKVINPRDSGVPNDHFTNYPGVINPTSSQASQGIRYMDPPRMPADLAEILKIYQDLFYKISGEFDLEQAQGQGSQVIAYQAIAALFEKAQTMLKGKAQNYGKMTRDRGRMFLSHVLNWYSEDRWVTYQDNGATVSKPIRGTDINIPVKLTVVSGSTMPRSKIQEREEAINLFQQGAIDREELLKQLDWNGRKQIIQRMQAGPFGELLQKIKAMGVPQPVMDAIQQISQTDDKQFQQLQQKGQVPQVGQILLQSAQQGQQGQGQLDPTTFADISVKDAEIKKIEAEAQLILAKIDTERMGQQATGAGIGFDKTKLDIERAQTLNAIEQAKHQRGMDKANFLHAREQAATAANNKSEPKKRSANTNPAIVETPSPLPQMMPPAMQTGSTTTPGAPPDIPQGQPAMSQFDGQADHSPTAGFNEHGMVSDNQPGASGLPQQPPPVISPGQGGNV